MLLPLSHIPMNQQHVHGIILRLLLFLLAAAMLTDGLPQHLVLFGVEPKSVDIGLELSETVEKSLKKLIKAVIEELGKIGCSVVPQDSSFSDKACFWETSQDSLNT